MLSIARKASYDMYMSFSQHETHNLRPPDARPEIVFRCHQYPFAAQNSMDKNTCLLQIHWPGWIGCNYRVVATIPMATKTKMIKASEFKIDARLREIEKSI